MRGQIWFVAKGKDYMHKSGGARPAIIVSGEERNTHGDRVMVVFLTTHDYEREDKVSVMVKNTKSYAVCDNINTVYKDQLSNYVGTVDEETMKEIDQQMGMALGLKEKNHPVVSFCVGCDAEAKKKALKKENEELEKKNREIQHEAKFYKRAYEDLLAKVMAR